jgi:hypothetical protein
MFLVSLKIKKWPKSTKLFFLIKILILKKAALPTGKPFSSQGIVSKYFLRYFLAYQFIFYYKKYRKLVCLPFKTPILKIKKLHIYICKKKTKKVCLP